MSGRNWHDFQPANWWKLHFDKYFINFKWTTIALYSLKMAKGIRSKSMRKNRSYLRATLSEPISKKRQEEIHDSLTKQIETKKSTTTLINLKKLLPSTTGSESNSKVSKEAEVEDEMEEEDEEEVEAVKPAPKKSKKPNPFKKDKVVKAAKPTKEMVWFK